MARTRTYLRARELVNGVYREAFVPIELEQHPASGGDGARLHRGAGPSDLCRTAAARPQARLIRSGKGVSGANLDYLVSTVRHLRELGIRERELERLVTMAGPLAWARARAQHTSRYAAALVRTLQHRPPPVRLPRGTERGQFLFRQRIGT